MLLAYEKIYWGSLWSRSLVSNSFHSHSYVSYYAKLVTVSSIDFISNRIIAEVTDRNLEKFRVEIILATFTSSSIQHFIDILINNPSIVSRILKGELDPQLSILAEKAGLYLFGKEAQDIIKICSCQQANLPCTHVIAVIHQVAKELNKNPFLIFQLHGIDLIKELNRRGMYDSRKKDELTQLEERYFERKSKSTKSSYDVQLAYQKLFYRNIHQIIEPLLALLDNSPEFYYRSADFKDKYSKALHLVSKAAQKLLVGKMDPKILFQSPYPIELKIGIHSDCILSMDEKFAIHLKLNEKPYPLTLFFAQLFKIPSSKILDYQPRIAIFHTIFHLALHLIAEGAIVPQLIKLPNDSVFIRWMPALLSKDVKKIVDQLQGSVPPNSFYWLGSKRKRSINKEVHVNLLSAFITELVSLFKEKDSYDKYLDLFFRKKQADFSGYQEDTADLQIKHWLDKYQIQQGNYHLQLLVFEANDDMFELQVRVRKIDKPLKIANTLNDVMTLKKFEKQRFQILQSISQLKTFIPNLENYINAKGKENISMTINQFSPFLFNMIPAIQLLNIDVLLPKSLGQILRAKPSVKLKRKEGKSFLRLDELLDFDWQIAIGDHVVDQEDFYKLLQRTDRLIKYKAHYLYVTREDLQKIHAHFSTNPRIKPFQLLQTALSGEYLGSKIVITEEIKQLINELSDFKLLESPKLINATLRPYQERGFSWMYRNAQVGFGSVLADDMGLGKTIQVIATLLKYKEEGLLTDKKALIISPTGLLSNWQAELERFAPTLKIHLYHGHRRDADKSFDIMLTTYGIVRSDAQKLKSYNWHTLIIDEAQNIKNHDTAQAKAIKSIPAGNFIALSGTPVENRLSELWSIMDFSNRGILGNPKEFKTNYGIPIEIYNDNSVAERLKKVTAPFMMRRLKTDKTIIDDLPDKIEMDCFATLVKEQASLYEKTLEEAMKAIEIIDASDKKGLFVRQGLVLQMILALKQICNHPTQFLKNNVLDDSLSGKMNLLYDKLDSIMDSGEKVLIFTQFTEMGRLLQYFINQRYQEMPLFYHGGCSIQQRAEMVHAFQTNPADKVFILSLTSAGTGLNLTAANHVIHYDLWWNPAVENQATDRAYRIGQHSNVMVHRFITKNTFEERINDMIQTKKALADLTVATGENWIGNLSNKELNELFVMGLST